MSEAPERQPWDEGELEENKSKMLKKLREMLIKATRGKQLCGWPSNARQELPKLGLILKIAPEATQSRLIEEILLDTDTKTYHKPEVEYVLEAIHKKWIKLVRKDEADDVAAPVVTA
ncbi:hypothetical protein PCANC_02348 [Puccinia coronata f. sp. avenae]|uniref:Uncharacterized protein n=1 Tax=Puccinia coronata f. sp. avenae TaxID=200324 RepID=A0A2N5VZH4_9BASI|nr:hypothetical protein PCANC_02348 [Puccinia coronata f. sp. avenae]